MTDREFLGCDRVKIADGERHTANGAVLMPPACFAIGGGFVNYPAGFRVFLVLREAYCAFAVLPGMRRGSRYDFSAFAFFRMRIVVIRINSCILMMIGVKITVRVAAFLAVRRLHAVCRAAGVFAAVLADLTDAFFIKIVRFGFLHHAAAAPMRFVGGFGFQIIL